MNLLFIAPESPVQAKILAELEAHDEFTVHYARELTTAQTAPEWAELDIVVLLSAEPNDPTAEALHALREQNPTLAIIVAGQELTPTTQALLDAERIAWLPQAQLNTPDLAVILQESYHQFHLHLLDFERQGRASLFAQLPLALMMLDSNGYILRANERIAALFRAAPENLIGHSFVDRLAPRSTDGKSAVEKFRAGLLTARNGASIDMRLRYRRADNTYGEAHVTLYRYPALPHQTFYLLVFRDITTEHQYQQQLEVLNALAQQAFKNVDVTELLQLAVTEIQHRFDYDNVSIFMLRGEVLHLLAQAGYEIPQVPLGYQVPITKGIVGWAIRKQEAVIVPDVTQDKRFYSPGPTAAQSALAIPVITDEGIIGVLYLESHIRNAFAREDLATLQTLCQLLGLITHRRNADLELAFRDNLQRAILELAPVLLTEFDLNALLERIIQEAVRLIAVAQSGSLLLLEGDHFAFRGLAGYDEALKNVYLPGNNYFVPNLQRGEVVHIRQMAQQDRDNLTPETAAALRRYGRTEEIFETMAAPLLVNGELLGYLTVDTFTPDAEFDAVAEEALSLFASLAAIAIYNARLFQAEHRARALAEGLREISNTLSATLNVDQVLDHLLEALTQLIACDAVDIMLVEGDEAYISRGQGREKFGDPSIERHTRFPLAQLTNLRRAAEQKTPYLIEDTAAFTDWVEVPDSNWMRTHIAAPIFLEQELVGFLCAQNARPGTLTLQDAGLMAVLAPMAGMALHNARLFQHEREARALAETLKSIGTALTQTLDQEEIIQTVAEQIPRLIPFHTLIITLIREDQRMGAVYTQGLTPAVDQQFRNGIAIENFPLWQELTKTGESLLLPDVTQEPRWIFMEGARQVSALIAPLRTRGHIIGFLNLTMDRIGFYQPQHLNALQSLADLLVVALSNAHLYQETQQRASDLEAIRRLGIQTSALQQPGDIIQTTLDYALELTEADGGAFFEYDPALHLLVQRQSSANIAQFQGYKIPPGAGVSGQAWQTQNPLVVRSYATWKERVDYPISSAICAIVSIPVTWQKERLGTLTIFHQAPDRAFSQNEVRVLQLLAQQLAATLYRANLFQAVRRDRDRLAALTTIDQQIIALSETPAVALQLILNYAIELLELPKGLVLLMHHDQEHTFYAQGLHDAPEAERRLVKAWGRERAIHAQHSQQGYLAFDTIPPQADSPYSWTVAENVKAVLHFPLSIREEIAGLLSLMDNRPHPWSDEEIALGQMLARQASIALEKALLSRELRLRLEEAEALNSVLQAANTTLDPQEMLRLTGQELRHTLQAPRVTAALLRNREKAPLSIPPRKLYTWILGEPQPVEREPLLEELLAAQCTLTFADLPTERPDIAAQLSAPPVRGVLMTPLMIRGELLGALIAESPEPRSFTAREIVLSESIAAAITPALENAHLYQETQMARQRTEEAYAHLRRLDSLKSQFIQNVSHELRTPLAIVKGYVDLVLDESFDFEMDATLQQAMSAIQTHTNNLVRLVESITSLEDAEMENFNFYPQPILPVFLTSLQSIRQAAMRKQLELVTELPLELPLVSVDPQRMGHALSHLLDNAVKFNHTGGKITLRAWVKDDEVWLQVCDTGIGIPPDELERIFDRFYQIDGSSSRQYGGMGLGLSIVKEVIECHQGRVWAASEGRNRGSIFTIVLPIHHPEEAA